MTFWQLVACMTRPMQSRQLDFSIVFSISSSYNPNSCTLKHVLKCLRVRYECKNRNRSERTDAMSLTQRISVAKVHTFLPQKGLKHTSQGNNQSTICKVARHRPTSSRCVWTRVEGVGDKPWSLLSSGFGSTIDL